jgi:hypothetical protein
VHALSKQDMHKVNQYFIKQPRFYTLLGDIRTAHHIDIL